MSFFTRVCVLSASLSAVALGGCGRDVDAPRDGGALDAGRAVEVIVRVASGDPGAVGPCRATFFGLDGTRDPDWSSSASEVGAWLGADAVAIDRTVSAARCDLRVPLAEGRYRVEVARGFEYERFVAVFDVRDAGPPPIEGRMPQRVQRVGFVCADLHVHSAPSFDSDVPLEQRIVGALAEDLDAFAATDHDALGDWDSSLAALAVADALTVVPGNELTPDQWEAGHALGHFNMFPVPPGFDPATLVLPGVDVEVLARSVRAAAPDAILQINHPRWNEWIGHFDVIDFDPITGRGRSGMLLSDFDAIELWNGHELDRDEPFDVDEVLVDYFALLETGRRATATANSDTHRLSRSPVGSPRTCLFTDETARPVPVDAIVDALERGAAFGTNGPYLTATIDGLGPGATVAPSTEATLSIHVDAPAFARIDQLQVVVSGSVVEARSVADLRADVTLALSLADGDYVMVLARGSTPLDAATAAHAQPMFPFAFTNPIFVRAEP